MGGEVKPDLVCVPPCAPAGLQHNLVTAPMSQVGRVRDPHMRAERRHRPMDKRPAPFNSVREKGRIFVIRRCMITPYLSKVRKSLVRASETPGPPRGIRRVSDGVLLQLRHVGQPRILDAPQLFGVFIRVRHERGCRINIPSVDSVPGAGGAKMRKPRRSSTRHSSRVDPSSSSVAPALNTLLIEYGQSLLVKIGLPGWR